MRKKVVFVIVEGTSDAVSLEGLIRSCYVENEVFIKIYNCDLTTEKGTNAQNVVTKLSDVIRDYACRNHLQKSDFKEILQITDTDGAFVPDEYIRENKTINKTQYFETYIETNLRTKILNRNDQKSRVLNKLSQTSSVFGGIPYQIYFMSVNLDHVLHNKPNSSSKEKRLNSLRISNIYLDKYDDFINYICNSYFSLNKDYRSSWEFIKQENNSLKRYTNLPILLKGEIKQ